MAISYPLTMPSSPTPRTITPRFQNIGKISESPFTLKQQVVQHTGQRWEFDLDFPPMTNGEVRDWLGFLASLKGHYGTFLCGDFSYDRAGGSRGVLSGTPVVDGAGQVGSTLAIRGASTSVTGWAKAGDLIQLGSGSTATLKMVLQDADTDVSGDVTLDIWPDVRTALTDGATVTVSSPKGVFRLSEPVVAFSVDSAVRYGISFSIVEKVQ